MIKFKNITLVNSDGGDWIGIYIDGVLVRENHSYEADDMLGILGIDYDEHWIGMEDGSRLPAKLEDLKDRIKE